jgi:hypothetical protein
MVPQPALGTAGRAVTAAWAGPGLRWLLLGAAALLGGLGTSASSAADPGLLETQVKAAYLAKFASYAEWPPARFADAASPLVIGVLGDDALAEELAAHSRGQTVKGRRIEVRRVSVDDALAPVHVLFVGADTPDDKLDALFARLRGQPVLTVADSRAAQRRGSMITFVARNQRLRFDVALAPAAASDIRLSALLLTAANRVVRSP